LVHVVSPPGVRARSGEIRLHTAHRNTAKHIQPNKHAMIYHA